jgi:hypothetical protein
MSDEKDRFGQKLHDLEKAREDQWARDEDRRLIEKMRAAREEDHKVLGELRQRHPAELHCPQCNTVLAPRAVGGIGMLECPSEHGAWLDAESLRQMIKG